MDCVHYSGIVAQTNSTQIGTAIVLINHIFVEIAALVAQNQISTTQIGPTNNTTNIQGNIELLVIPTQIGPQLSTICWVICICTPLQSQRKMIALLSCLCNLCISSALRCLLLIQLLLHLLKVAANLLLLLMQNHYTLR